MKPRTPFQPLDEDLDTKIETLAREKGVSTLVKPGQAEQGPSPINPSPVVAAPVRSLAPTAETSAFDAAPARTPMKTLNVELPDYVWTALKIRAAEQKASVRHVIMTALRRDGVAINEIDMMDASLRTRSLKSKEER